MVGMFSAQLVGKEISQTVWKTTSKWKKTFTLMCCKVEDTIVYITLELLVTLRMWWISTCLHTKSTTLTFIGSLSRSMKWHIKMIHITPTCQIEIKSKSVDQEDMIDLESKPQTKKENQSLLEPIKLKFSMMKFKKELLVMLGSSTIETIL